MAELGFKLMTPGSVVSLLPAVSRNLIDQHPVNLLHSRFLLCFMTLWVNAVLINVNFKFIRVNSLIISCK